MINQKTQDKLLKKIEDIPEQEVRNILMEIYTFYLSPSFGSISKREIDIMMFSKLVDVGVFGNKPQVYDIMRELRITRAKANNLLYEYNLRENDSDDDMNQQLVDLLSNPLLDKVISQRKVGIEIENRLLKDYIRNILKEMGYITDTSFNKDILYMSFEAYSDLFYRNSSITEEKARKILVEKGIVTSMVDVGDKALVFLLTKVAGDNSKELLDTVKQFIKDLKK